MLKKGIKNSAWIVSGIVLGAFMVSQVIAQAPGWSCRIHLPPNPYSFHKEDLEKLMWIEITNKEKESVSVYLHGEITKDGKLIARANSNRIEIPKGGKRITRGDITKLSDEWWDKKLEKQLVRAPILPEGKYEACVYVYKWGTKELLTKCCTSFESKPIAPPRLISPKDGATIKEKHPLFKWTPPKLRPPKVTYDLKIVEVRKGQSKEDAMRNPPFFQKKGIAASSFKYPLSGPPFEEGKKYAWQIQVFLQNYPVGEREGKSEIRQFEIIRIHPRVPAIPFPSIDISRDITRVGNYFEIILTITNKDTVTLRDIEITTENIGFQFSSFGWMRGRGGSGVWSDWHGYLFLGHTETNYIKNKCTWHWGKISRLSPDSTIQIKSKAVPVLFPPYFYFYSKMPLKYVICNSFQITFNAEGRDYLIRRRDLKYNNQTEVMNAFRSSDYLIVTCPEKLFLNNPGAEEDVNKLLEKIAELALCRNGVLGYSAAVWGAQVLKGVIDPSRHGKWGWGQRLSPSWGENGYLLLVGETEIIPSFDVDSVRLSDYLYADIAGDRQPKLKVGRIIGSTAEELTRPIQASLDVYKGVADYDGSDALMISGYEDTWEAFVKGVEQGKDTLLGKGVTVSVVHTDFYDTKKNMLSCALRTLGSQGRTDDANCVCFDRDGNCCFQIKPGYSVCDSCVWGTSRSLPADTLPSGEYKYEALRGAPFDSDLSGYSLSQLAAWMLWAWHIISDEERDRILRTPDYYISTTEMRRALDYAENIMTVRVGRGGSNYGWSYTYLYDLQVLPRRAQEIKSRTSNKDIIIFYGHGGAGSWACVLDDWTTSSCPIEPISFGNSCPIVIAFACLTGNYKEEPRRSIARAFLRNGAAAYFGSTEESRSDYNTRMIEDIFWRYWSKRSRIGDTIFNLKKWMIREGGWLKTCYKYNLYGDPKFGRR